MRLSFCRDPVTPGSEDKKSFSSYKVPLLILFLRVFLIPGSARKNLRPKPGVFRIIPRNGTYVETERGVSNHSEFLSSEALLPFPGLSVHPFPLAGGGNDTTVSTVSISPARPLIAVISPRCGGKKRLRAMITLDSEKHLTLTI